MCATGLRVVVTSDVPRTSWGKAPDVLAYISLPARRLVLTINVVCSLSWRSIREPDHLPPTLECPEGLRWESWSQN